MKKFMFGLDDAQPMASAKKLVDLGYDGVVLGGNPTQFEAAQACGLETWLSYGAHGIGSFSQAEFGAQNPFGEPAPWFGSACPNAEEVNRFNLNRALETAKAVHAKGIFVDGARFASFASAEGPESFFGCFCPRCMSKMIWMGMDAPKIKDSIGKLMLYLRDGTVEKNSIPVLRSAIDAWLDFRAACVKEYMDQFAAQAHEAGLQAAAFVFAPSLWWFVGQRPTSCGALDLVSPMLYRAYPHEEGPACLNHEWAAFQTLLSHTDRPASDLASMLFDMALLSDDPMKGFPPEHVGVETEAARAMLPRRISVLPIVQTEDDRLAETCQAVLDAGADGYGEFMYSQKTFA